MLMPESHMRKLILIPLMFCVINTFAAERSTQNSIWVAKLSEQVQCSDLMNTKPPSLSTAIAELENVGNFTVKNASLGRLQDKMFCSACQCPAGTYYIAEVTLTPHSEENLPAGWETISPLEIIKKANIQ